MIRKYREGIKRTLCFFLTAGVFLGGFFHPAFAGEVPEKETEKLAVFSEEEIEWIAEKAVTEEPVSEEFVTEEPVSQETKIQETKVQETECVEVTSLREMARAVEKEEPEEMEDFSGKCLIAPEDVKPEEFELCAERILTGCGLAVLFYDSEEKAGDDYKKLKEQGVSVEINARVKTCGEAEVSFEKELKPVSFKGEEDTKKGAEVTVVVLDSGYDFASLGDARIKGGMDFTGENTIADRNGHGTAMASVLLMNTPDEIKVMPVKVADETGDTTVLHMYMGIRYAMEQGADIINISMSAYKSAHSKILEDVVKEASSRGIFVVASAGNQGEDLSGYTPANIKDAVTVAAVGSDKVREAYSNYGTGVDYCAYGSLEVKGISGQKITAKGTSVSAAIVSSLLAWVKSQNPQKSRDEILGILDSLGEDLGEKGEDIYYGRGFLTFDFLKAGETEGEEPEKLPELLRCTWKNLSDEDLNKLILDAPDIYKKRFLDHMTKEQRQELLGRKHILFNQNHGAVMQEVSENGRFGEEKRFQGTLYQYLYSDFFKEFHVNGSASNEHNGASQTIHISARSKGSYFVNLTTSQNKTPARLYVWVNGYTSNPSSKYTIHAEGTNAGAFDFSKISVSAKASGPLNEIMVGDIKVKKTRHTTLKDKYQTRSYVKGDPDYKEDESGDGGLGGFGKPGSDACDKESQKFSFRFTHNDGEHSSSNGSYALTYQLNYGGNHGTTPGNWGEWKTLEQNTCLRNGKKVHSRELICSHCKKTVRTELKEEMIPAHGHSFPSGAWNYETCPSSGISQGVRYEQCTYHCGEEGWRKSYQYLNEIYYRAMDSQGNYPGDYTLHESKYYPAGAVVSGYVSQDREGKTNHRAYVLPESTAPAFARRQYVDIPRKEYTVRYDGNGADSGEIKEQKVYFGQTFSLMPNGFSKTGYDFLGYSRNPQGEGDTFAGGQKINENLTWEDFGVVTLYARWQPCIYKITLDSQGAFAPGTGEVYQKYGKYYSKEKGKESPFENGRIVIPQKNRPEETLFGGERRQKFVGYFTEENGKGHAMVKEDGTLIPDIGGSRDYRYFTRDARVYACYKDMNAIQFSDNLSEKDKRVLGEGENILPKTKWKEQGRDITVFFEGAEVSHKDFKKVYRFLGWSLTPEISGMEELVLSPEKTSFVFREDEDVTLYAQWDSSFCIAYMGNAQTLGEDYLEQVESAGEKYTFRGNDLEYFKKEVEKETVDIATGEEKDKEGKICKEIVPYSFQGWSMFCDKKQQEENKKYTKEEGEVEGREILLDGVNTSEVLPGKGLTFGVLASDFVNPTLDLQGEDVPYINMFAVWDEFPQIKAGDLYFSLKEAQSGKLTQEYLLGLAEATDKELEGVTDEKGTISCGEDRKHHSTFLILDYRAEDFTEAEEDMSMTITYYARDAVGNETKKMVTVHLADTFPRKCESGNVRFISQEHVDTLSENSVWRTEEYASILKRTLNNHKTGEEYTKPSAAEQIFGAKPVKKPGSGTWERVQQVWQFTHEQVLLAQEFLEQRGIQSSQQAFLQEFGSCRVQ